MTRTIKKIILYLALIFYALFTLLPIYWTLITSFKTSVELARMPPTLFPTNPTLYFYADLISMRHFLELVRNSLIVSSVSAALSVFMGTLLSYGISRMVSSERNKNLASMSVVIFRMFPAFTLIIPYYIIFSNLNLLNTYYALIIIYLTFGLPFATWTMKGFFDEFPPATEEAALVDGCSRFGAFFRIVLPILLPSIFVTYIFSFLYCWNEFLYALILTTTYETQTITIGVFATVSKWEIAWSRIAAAGVFAALPVIVLFMVVRKYVVRGMTFGVVKG